MRNIIIFGGAGFVGSHFMRFVKKEYPDFNIISTDINTNDEVMYADVREPIELEGNFSTNDIIINLAATHRTPGHPDHEYFETNIRGAENVCAFADKHNINNIIFTSSIAPYGASENLKLELTLPEPNTPYGISKLVAEHIHKEWQVKESSRKLLILRPGVIFGRGENGNFTRLYNALRKGHFFYPGRKDTIKACIYVKELVQLSFQILDSFSTGNRTYNFTYEPAKTIEEIVKTISKVTGVKNPKLVVSSGLLIAAAKTLNILGGGVLGIHPSRVKKLMYSTNISGKKLVSDNYEFKYTLESAVTDWYIDCEKQGLY